jgi:hypothetical protein
MDIAVACEGDLGILISELMLTHNLEKLLLALTAMRLKFNEFKQGGLHEKFAVATWNLESISAFP